MQVLVIGPEADAVAARIDPAAVDALEAEATASPLTSARHAGFTVDAAELAGRLREAPVGAVAAGLLAPLTPRYAVRDLAAELGAPVLLTVPAGPSAVSDARLALGAARGARLRVIDVVLTGWPELPDRAQLDDRALLSELADVPVVTFPAGDPWPVEEWLAAPVEAEAAAPARVGGPVVLEPYREWSARPVGDPRATPRPQIMAALLEIIEAEGPVLATRAFALYNRASGGRKLTTIARAPLSSALYWLAQERRIVLLGADDIPWQDDDLARTPDAPAVHVRELGPRTLEEVPLDEIAELMRRQAAGDPAAAKRAVLAAYGLRRLTTRADAYLELAAGLAAD
jgi:hypothetical protein